MAVILCGLLFFIYIFYVSQFDPDVFIDAKKHVIPYLIEYLKEFGGQGGRLLANENDAGEQGHEDPFLKHDTDMIQDSNALMVVPPEADPISLAMATVIRVTVVILTVLGLAWTAVIIVKSWKCLLKDNEHMKEKNEMFEYSRETLRRALDLREKESKREIRKRSEQMSEEINHLTAALKEEIMAKNNTIGSLHRTYDSILELQQHEMDALQQKLAEDRYKKREDEAKMMVERTVYKETIQSIREQQEVQINEHEEMLKELKKVFTAIQQANEELKL